MNEYLIFSVNADFEQGTLKSHLNYLRSWGGTPEHWDSADNLFDAVDKARGFARGSGDKVAIVDTMDYQIVDTFEVQS